MADTENQHEVKLKKLAFYRSEIMNEFALLNNRVSALVTSQSFLTIAFASAMNNTNARWGTIFTLVFPICLASLGIATSLRAQQGIAAAADTITLWHVKQNILFEHDPAMEDYRVQRPSRGAAVDSPVDDVHRRSLAFSRVAPRIFLIAWCLFGGLAVLLHVL